MTITSRQANYALLLLTLSYALNLIDRQIMSVLIEPIKLEFGASDLQMGLLSGLAFALFYITLSIPIARLADIHSRRNILAISCGLWSAMTVLCGTASNYWQLALARLGVGVGEAGGGPPALSMIADYYPPERRSFATGIYSTAPQWGTLIGMAGGAWIADQYGWRVAFFVAGAPGILLALMIRYTLREPVRGRWERTQASPTTPQTQDTLWQSLAIIVRTPAFGWMTLGCAMMSLLGNAMGMWNTSFLLRTHGLTLTEAGVLMSLAQSITGILGGLFSGWLCDRLVSRDYRWQLRLPAIAALVGTPLSLLYFLWPAGTLWQVWELRMPVSTPFVTLYSFFGVWWIATSYAALAHMMPARRRALASATLLLLFNVAGLVAGPFLVGWLSDHLASDHGANALQQALGIVMLAHLVAAFAYWRAMRTYQPLS